MDSSRITFLSVQALFGLLVLLFGVALLLDNLDVMQAGEILRYWPALLILFGLVKALEPGPSGGKVFGVVVAFIGLILLLGNLDVFYVHLWDLWPLIIVIVGISMIWRVLGATTMTQSGGGVETFVSGTAIMGGWKRAVASPDFAGGQLSAIMGGCELDLRGCTMKGEEAVIDIFAFWGGVEMRVPQGWRVVTKATPILGGIEDKTKSPEDSGAKRLVVHGTVIMGGAEIKN